jgi:hypothetical protein
MKVIMWLQVRESDLPLGVMGNLWFKEVETDYIPFPGVDQILLGPWEEDPSDGPTWYVKQRVMSSDGTWGLELLAMSINPTEMGLDAQSKPWDTINQGDPEELLVRGGWQKSGAVNEV